MGRKEVDFPLKSGKYESHVSDDMKIFYITNKETGHHVFVDTTGAIKAGENRYVVTGESKEQIALKYNIPLDQITENTATYTIEHYESRSPLAPITTYTITVGTNSKKQLDCSSDVNDIDGINRGKKGQETCDANDKFTEGAAANTIYRQKVFEELEKISGIGNIVGKKINYNFGDEFHEYTVKSGETVWGIATQYGITVDQLVEISGNEFLKESRVKDSKGKDYILIKPDQKINVPAVSDPNNKENDQAPRDVRSNTKIKNALEAFNYATTFISPLVIDLDGDGIELSHVHDNPVFFDIDGDGNLEKIGWVKPDDGHLAMDRNGNGQIDDITELYGDDVIPAFKKLALHDENEDGLIDEKDSDYNKILVWRDLNQNGVSESEELKTLRETGIASISLQETKKEEYNQDNLITGTSEFTWLNGTKGEIADVHYVNDKINSWYVGKGAAFTPVAINPDVLSLPNSRGYGTLPSLHIAMSHNGELLEMVREFSDLPTNKWGELLPRIEGILFEWAGSTDAFNTRSNPDNKNNFGADKIGFLERFTGQKYQQVGNDDLLGTSAQKELHKAFYYATYNIKMNLLVQGPLKELFKGHNLDTSYKIFQDRLKFDTTKHNIAKAVVNLALSQPDSYLAPDVFNLLLEIVFDDQNDIRSKDFSFEEQILSVMQGSQMQGIFTSIQNVLHDHKDEFDKPNIVPKLTAKVIKDFLKMPSDEEIFNEHASVFADKSATKIILSTDSTDFEKETGININNFLYGSTASILNNFNVIIQPTENQTKLLFKSLINLNNALILYKRYANDLKMFKEYDCDLQILTEGSDLIDLSNSDNLYNTLIYAKNGDDIVKGVRENRNVLLGEGGNDWLIGGEKNDYLDGDSGNDFLFGGDGNDIIKGGDGDDYIEGGNGVDYMDGGSGTDTLSYKKAVYINLLTGEVFGSASNRRLIERESSYTMEGEEIVVDKNSETSLLAMINPKTNEEYKKFKDELPSLKKEFMEKSKDAEINYMMLYAESKGYLKVQRDTFINFENIHGSHFDDVLVGDEKDNYINGESGDDYIDGGDGDDDLFGADGNDTLIGGTGNDDITGGEGADYIDGGDGFDTLHYASFYETEPVYVNLKTGEAKGGEAEGDKFINVEAVRGSRFDDILVGNSGNNILKGEKGDDILFGNGGIDVLLGGKGENTFVIKDGQKGKTIIPDFSSKDTIAFIGYNQYDQNRIKYDIFSKFGIAFEEDGMQNCRVVSPKTAYNFNLGSEQELQINGQVNESNLPIFIDYSGITSDYGLENNRLICPSDFQFLDSIQEIKGTSLKGYDIFA